MDTISSDARPFRIGFLLIDGFALMSYASAIEPLRAANLLAEHMLYDIRHIHAEGRAARSSSGAEVPAIEVQDAGTDHDMVLVVAGGDPMQFTNERVLGWLRRLDRQGVVLGGVSGGPAVLANAGLMAGRRMTIHWEHMPALLERHPDLLLEKALFVLDRNRVTCAGGSAPLDLMHALIALHHGQAFARGVSDWFMHTEVRPSAGPQRAGLVERYGTTNGAILLAIEVMETHISDPLDLGQLAGFAGVSERQLNRLFREKMGRSAMAFYRSLRLGKARNLIQTSSVPLTEIALATGFASSAHFSNAYSAEFGAPPSQVRRQ
ncbi:GlxA family transcriptional regulator [Ostreiculturibacter nitratireducens]|uniref:GlxA family transcriptional regulator n=1 Tax=Ostreiculturibacter nitratireducens TaxID=3075226 RepID=UPI0031B59633